MPSERPRTPLADCRIRQPLAYRSDNRFGRADRRVAERAAEQWGVLDIGELFACGLSRQAVAVRERRGWLHRLYPAVYAVGHPNPPREGWLLAAVKACGPTAALSHAGAAEVWGLIEPLDRYPDVTIVGTGARSHRGINVHRTIALDDRDRAHRREIPVTAPARTLLELGAIVPTPVVRRAAREALAQRRVRLAALVDALDRLAPRPGAGKLRRALAGGAVPTRSELEDVLFALILGAGFEPPVVNGPLRIDGRWLRPDFRWPRQRLVVEADGAVWHDHALARAADADRQALLEAHGERVVRVSWPQAVGEPAPTIRRLASAGAPFAGAVVGSVRVARTNPTTAARRAA